MAREPAQIADSVVQYRKLTDELGKPRGDVTVMTGLPLADKSATQGLLATYQEMGVDRLVCALRYTDVASYTAELDKLTDCLA